MRLEPEAVGVLRDLDAQIGSVEIGAEVLLDAVGDGLALEGLVERLADGKAAHVLGVEVLARVVVQFALARDAVERRRLERQAENGVERIVGQAVGEEPVPVGRVCVRLELSMLSSIESTIACGVMAMWRCFPWVKRQERMKPAPRELSLETAGALAPTERMQRSPERSDGSEARCRHLASAAARSAIVGVPQFAARRVGARGAAQEKRPRIRRIRGPRSWGRAIVWGESVVGW